MSQRISWKEKKKITKEDPGRNNEVLNDWSLEAIPEVIPNEIRDGSLWTIIILCIIYNLGRHPWRNSKQSIGHISKIIPKGVRPRAALFSHVLWESMLTWDTTMLHTAESLWIFWRNSWKNLSKSLLTEFTQQLTQEIHKKIAEGIPKKYFHRNNRRNF